MGYDFVTTKVTMFMKYVCRHNSVRYKRYVIDKCKISEHQGIQIGQGMILETNNSKMMVFEKDLDMKKYVVAEKFKGRGFTFANENIVVIGEHDDITSVSQIVGRHYTIKNVSHNDYSFTLDHHFSLSLS